MENQIETSGSALATGSIAARFVSQDTLNEANERREKEWKAAYARIGQEPPSQMTEAPEDGRTLFERLEEQRIKKQEEWDDKMKLANQYRGLESEELTFLSGKIQERRDKERKAEEEDNAQVLEYRGALAKKHAAELAAGEPQLSGSTAKGRPVAAPPKRLPPKAPRKDIKSLMKGVVVKKKPAPAPAGKGAMVGTGSAAAGTATSEAKGLKRTLHDDAQGDAKRKM